MNPGAGIPAAVGLPRVVDADRDHIAIIEAQMRCQLVAKRNEPVRASAERMAVDPYFAVLIHTVELQCDQPAAIQPWQHQPLPIPADAGGQITACPGRWLRLGARTLDAPVVRKVDLAPVSIRELWQMRAFGIAPGEAPAEIEAFARPRRNCVRAVCRQNAFRVANPRRDRKGCNALRCSAEQVATREQGGGSPRFWRPSIHFLVRVARYATPSGTVRRRNRGRIRPKSEYFRVRTAQR